MTLLNELRQSIEDGHPNDSQLLVSRALDQHIDPSDIVEKAMIPAMKSVGESYKQYDSNIPNILAAARCVKRGFDVLEDKFGSMDKRSIGTVILGTIEGDLHDVGKNIVAIMFRSAGFKVIDLGVDNSEKQFLKALRENPDVNIVCISSLLTTANPEMQHVVKALRRHDKQHRLRIMVGGGAVTQEFADSIGADAYTDSAVDAAEKAKTFIV